MSGTLCYLPCSPREFFFSLTASPEIGRKNISHGRGAGLPQIDNSIFQRSLAVNKGRGKSALITCNHLHENIHSSVLWKYNKRETRASMWDILYEERVVTRGDDNASNDYAWTDYEMNNNEVFVDSSSWNVRGIRAVENPWRGWRQDRTAGSRFSTRRREKENEKGSDGRRIPGGGRTPSVAAQTAAPRKASTWPPLVELAACNKSLQNVSASPRFSLELSRTRKNKSRTFANRPIKSVPLYESFVWYLFGVVDLGASTATRSQRGSLRDIVSSW